MPVSAPQIAELLDLVAAGTISGKQAKELYASLRGTSRKPSDLVVERGMQQVSDASVLEEVVKRVLAASSKQVAQLRGGKTGVMGYLVGQVMKETKGSANPKLVNELIEKLIAS